MTDVANVSDSQAQSQRVPGEAKQHAPVDASRVASMFQGAAGPSDDKGSVLLDSLFLFHLMASQVARVDRPGAVTWAAQLRTVSRCICIRWTCKSSSASLGQTRRCHRA